MTNEEYQRYKELGNLLNNGADITDEELSEYAELERQLYKPVGGTSEAIYDSFICPNKRRYIR